MSDRPHASFSKVLKVLRLNSGNGSLHWSLSAEFHSIVFVCARARVCVRATLTLYESQIQVY